MIVRLKPLGKTNRQTKPIKIPTSISHIIHKKNKETKFKKKKKIKKIIYILQTLIEFFESYNKKLVFIKQVHKHKIKKKKSYCNQLENWKGLTKFNQPKGA